MRLERLSACWALESLVMDQSVFPRRIQIEKTIKGFLVTHAFPSGHAHERFFNELLGSFFIGGYNCANPKYDFNFSSQWDKEPSIFTHPIDWSTESTVLLALSTLQVTDSEDDKSQQGHWLTEYERASIQHQPAPDLSKPANTRDMTELELFYSARLTRAQAHLKHRLWHTSLAQFPPLAPAISGALPIDDMLVVSDWYDNCFDIVKRWYSTDEFLQSKTTSLASMMSFRALALSFHPQAKFIRLFGSDYTSLMDQIAARTLARQEYQTSLSEFTLYLVFLSLTSLIAPGTHFGGHGSFESGTSEEDGSNSDTGTDTSNDSWVMHSSVSDSEVSELSPGDISHLATERAIASQFYRREGRL